MTQDKVKEDIRIRPIRWYYTPEDDGKIDVVLGEICGFNMFVITEIIDDESVVTKYHLRTEFPLIGIKIFIFDKKDDAKEYAQKLLTSFIRRFID